MQVERRGSVTVTVLMGIITVFLALLIIGVVSYTITNLSNNETRQAVSDDIKASLENTLSYCTAAGLTPAECQEIIDAVNKTYESVAPPKDENGGFGFGDLFNNLPLLIGGLLVVSIIGAVRK